MNLKIEYTLTGPLAHKHTCSTLHEIAEKAGTIEDAAVKIKMLLPSLATYKGGSHLAIHPADSNGRFQNGSHRLAIIT